MNIPDGYVLIPRELFEQMSRDARAWRDRPQYPVNIPIGPSFPMNPGHPAVWPYTVTCESMEPSDG